MLEGLKANIVFNQLLKRPNIDKAYAMVKPSDSWYDTITKVHDSLHQIQQLPHSVLEVISHDDLRLKGIYYPSKNGNGVTVICVHGYTSHAEREWAFPGLFYHSLGFNVLIPYQRAHGLSEGKYISFGAMEQLDVMKWIDKINEINPDGQILIHGLSMGGCIVLLLADKVLTNVKCLIADAPNVSITKFFRDVIAGSFKDGHEAIFERILKRYQKEFSADAGQYDGIKSVSESKYPILLAAGSNENLEDLFARIQEVNPMDTETVILPGCNHGNGMYKHTELFQNSIKGFVDKYIGR